MLPMRQSAIASPMCLGLLEGNKSGAGQLLGVGGASLGAGLFADQSPQ